MGADGILEKASTRFTIKDVEEQRVEPVSVIALDELERLIQSQVEERTAQLRAELDELRARLAEADAGGGGGLERAAAEAALQAESAALEAKAAAELRAEQAEARAAELGKKLEALEARASDAGRVAELEAKVKELEGRKPEAPKAPGPVPTARPATSKLGPGSGSGPAEAKPAPAKEAAPAPAPVSKPAAKPEAVTEDDHARALRTARGLIEDVINEDEATAQAAIKAGKFRTEFSAALGRARHSYERRVKEAVRAARDHWEQALKDLGA